MSLNTKKYDVLIADDHPLVRQGFISVINHDHVFDIVAECGDGDEAFDKIRTLKPDVAVLDVSMPGKTGLEIIKTVTVADMPTKFVILTMHKDEDFFNEAIDCGVKGYVLKESAVTDLLQCLRAVAQDKFYVSPVISDYLLRRSQQIRRQYERVPSLEKLTESEKLILRLLSRNKTSKEIADELFISYRTVENHRHNICKKLNLSGPHKLLLFAIEHRSLI